MLNRHSALRGSTIAIILVLSTSRDASTQDFGVCKSIITTGLREYSISTSSQASLNTIYDNYCGSSQTSHSSDFAAGLEAVVKAIPIKFTLGSSDSAQALSNFCHTYSENRQSSSSSSQYEEKIVTEAYKTFDHCMEIVRNGISVDHNVVSMDALTISFRAGVAHPIEIRGIATSPNVVCKGQTDSGSVVTYTLATREKSPTLLGVACDRTPDKIKGPAGQSLYKEGTIRITTSAGPYDIFWPRDEMLSEDVASSVQQQVKADQAQLVEHQKLISDVQSELNKDKGATKYVLSAGACPGSWHDIGTVGLIFSNAAYSQNPFGPGAGYNRDWTWAHPKLCARD